MTGSKETSSARAGLATPALFLLAFVAASAFSESAAANPEPSLYDARSQAMGMTGVTYLERPAALALNPANLEGIDRLGFTINFGLTYSKAFSPVQGPYTSVSTSGLGPLPAMFLAGRIAPRVVFGAGVYIESGISSDFADVVCIDGVVVGPPPDYTPDANPDTCFNNTAETLSVTFFTGEAAVGTSIRVTDKFWLGVALRLPFSFQEADLWSNIGAALGTLNYQQVTNELRGIGFPSPRIGITWKPHEKVTVAASYRMYSKINLTGTTKNELLSNLTGDEVFDAAADWTLPNMLQFGISSQVNERLLLVVELRLQFHGAKKTGNVNQTTVTTSPSNPDTQFVTTNGLGWVNVWSLRPGVEYRFKNDVVAWRGGMNLGNAANNPEWANFRTSPWGFGVSVQTGLGFYWDGKRAKDQWMLDLGVLMSFRRSSIGTEYIGQEATVPGTDDVTQVLCSDDQVVRTGCPGRRGTNSFIPSLAFTVEY